MEPYEPVKMEITIFDEEDVITISGTNAIVTPELDIPELDIPQGS